MTRDEKLALAQKMLTAQADEMTGLMEQAGMGEFGLLLIFASPETGPVPVSMGLNERGAIRVAEAACERMQRSVAQGHVMQPPPKQS